ncbi:MAG: twitching motility protein PilT [Acidimicrobiales bacterium]
MSALVLDAGALVAVDRGDRAMIARLRVAERSGMGLRSNGVVVAQVWRDPTGRQAELARLLRSVDVRAVDERLGRDAGVLLGRAGTSDPVDATVVVVASPGDRILTSDPRDIRGLVAASGLPILVVHC